MSIKLKTNILTPISFTFIFSFYLILIFNTSYFSTVTASLSNISEIDFLFFSFVRSLLICFFLISLFIWNSTYKIITGFILLTSALASYSIDTYQMKFEINFLSSIFGVSISEILQYISLNLLFWVAITTAPAIYLINKITLTRKSFIAELVVKISSMGIAIFCIQAIDSTYSKNFASLEINDAFVNHITVPSSVYIQTSNYLFSLYKQSEDSFNTIGDDSYVRNNLNTEKPYLMVVVIGESARSFNFKYNGYHRETNTYTEGLGVKYFKDVKSCSTSTAISLPCMFSTKTKNEFDYFQSKNESNLLDIFNYAKINTLWIDNNSNSQGVSNRYKEVIIDKKTSTEFRTPSSYHDIFFVRNLYKYIPETPQNTVLFFHLAGSHIPYHYRYPKEMEHFTPTCKTKNITACTHEEIINTYDNSILYTDYVISGLIKELKKHSSKFNTLLTYISDHGESLGENGVFLHLAPFSSAPKEQVTIPWLLWVSPESSISMSIDNECLNNHGPLSHDNFSHTLIGLMNIESSLYKPELDITSRCRIHQHLTTPPGTSLIKPSSSN